MIIDQAHIARALTYACSSCGARPGQWCHVKATSQPTKLHLWRLDRGLHRAKGQRGRRQPIARVLSSGHVVPAGVSLADLARQSR